MSYGTQTAGAIDHLLGTAEAGRVIMLTGISSSELQALIEPGETTGRMVLMLNARQTYPSLSIEQIIDSLADLTLSFWPVWYDNRDFSSYGRDTAGKLALKIQLREIGTLLPQVSQSWAASACSLAMAGLRPRVQSVAADVEVLQLCSAINASGLVLIFDLGSLPRAEEAWPLVNALEWVARVGNCAVVALVEQFPTDAPPYDRIRYGACTICGSDGPSKEAPEVGLKPLWVGPVRGRPHPLSTEEKRLAEALAADYELAALFAFNQTIETVHGSRPRVDLLWRIGRLVIEVDGYPDHGSRTAFARDRHRDYELLLSGYTVLRLANDEVARDLERTLGKIRAVVGLLRSRLMGSI